MCVHFGMQMRINFFQNMQFTAGFTVHTQVCINYGSIQ